jgi:hypothetical protein
MSDPTRFSDGGGNDLERLLADSVRDDAPSRRTRRRVEAALGIGAAVSTATASTSALGATVKTGVTLGVAKWIGIATVGVALAGAGTASYLSKGASPVAAPRVAVPSRPATPPSAIRVQTPPAIVPTVPAPIVTKAPVATEAPVVTEAPAPPASVSTVKPVAAAASIASVSSIASAKPAATLGDELRLLDQAHAALSAGDTSRALSLLDRHDREATKPALAPEALALRVEVYARLGDRASVTRTANQFLALYGDRPEAQRVRTILDANP